MRKLTSILVVLEQWSAAGMVLRKAVEFARPFDARIELLAIEPVLRGRTVPQCAAPGYPQIPVRTASRLGRRLDSVVLDHVQERNPDLVIKARAGSHPLRRCKLTHNDWRLSQECPVPLMLVGPRTWSNPPRIAAAVDVSDVESLKVARAVMHVAGFIAMGSRGNLDILYTEREEHDDTLRMERAVKLAQLVREFHVGCERLQMFDGIPEKRLPPLIASRQYDVLLLGAVTHRTGLEESLCPLTSRLVDAAAGDVVLVRPAAAGADTMRTPRSVGEQAPHERHQFV